MKCTLVVFYSFQWEVWHGESASVVKYYFCSYWHLAAYSILKMYPSMTGFTSEHFIASV